MARTKVNPLWPNPRFVSALHSPDGVFETGLRVCLPEKRWDGVPFAGEKSVLCSPVCPGIIAKCGQLSRISDVEEPIFSAVQTVWRRE
jgi:hypothetical protein